MPLASFPMHPPPEFPISRRAEYRTLDTSFGDGYELIMPDGINPRRDIVDLTWKTLTLAEKNPLENFLASVAPAVPFFYQGHDGRSGVFTCRAWTVDQISAAHWNMTATLRQFHGY